ncbi:hypothetical protein ACFQBQ_17645 [Granulicella cerasi]|uniref:Uncharacterized protein n=1 Tax=Granulicella cerasi TaxID=741063 RepID=A0ABW1ZFB7_9BACT
MPNERKNPNADLAELPDPALTPAELVTFDAAEPLDIQHDTDPAKEVPPHAASPTSDTLRSSSRSRASACCSAARSRSALLMQAHRAKPSSTR